MPRFRPPMEQIKSEYESFQSELDEQISLAHQELEQASIKFKGQERKLNSLRSKIKDDLKKRKEKILKKVNNSKTRRQFDKITFYLSLIVIQYKSFILGMSPDNWVYTFNFILLIVLLLWRNITYRIDNSHYYMLEFCYFANIVFYFFIFLFPESKTLYLASFAFCCGPVGWALALVGCSFVIHNINQLTSCFIHFTPMVLMMNLHWRTQYNEDRGWILYDAKQDTFGWTFVKDYFKSAVLVYLVWAVFYYVLVYVLLKNRIRERHYTTLATYHVDKKSSVGKYLLSLGPNFQGLMYVGTHFLCVFIIFSFTIICYFNMYVNIVIMFLSSSICFWNGATFYMDYFSKKYELNLQKLDELQDKVEEDLSPSKAKKKKN